VQTLKLVNFKLNLPEVMPMLEAKINDGLALVTTLSQLKAPSFENLVLPLSKFTADLGEFWTPVSHLNNVANTEDLRKVYEEGAIKLSEFFVSLGQHQGLYETYKKLKASAEFAKLSKPEQKIIDDALLDFELSGVGLPEQERTAFKTCQKQLVEATTQFERHLMDAIKAWHYDAENVEEFAGVPEVVLAQARAKAQAAGIKGYRFGIDAPTYMAIMGYAHDAKTRANFYRAYTTRASDLGEAQFDNSQVMVNLLNLRTQEAALLKYPHYANYALVKRMAKDPEQVLTFLYDLAKRSRTKALQDWQELQDFAKSEGHKMPLEAWDIAYFSERLKEKTLGFNEEALRVYFPLSQVWHGLLNLVETLFGIRFKEMQIKAWDPEVQFLEVHDDQGLVGGIYVDLYARDHKRSGAWMDECKALRMLPEGEVQRPLAFLNANFLPPGKGEEAQLTHDEVLTLFHELGHVLQHILTKISLPEIGGIHGIPWDAVELPSQFMENFCYEPKILKNLSKHVKTGQSLDDKLIEALRQSRTFQSGLMMLRQLEFAIFDMRLYLNNDIRSAEMVQNILDEVRHEIAVIIPPKFNRFQHSFSHIFAGGYAAGYYSYKWAELLSSDAFSRFEEEGILNPGVGRSFRNTVLGEGGSREALDIFIDFRGRAPTIDTLLRHSGIN
jgi:oligopeptidase A